MAPRIGRRAVGVLALCTSGCAGSQPSTGASGSAVPGRPHHVGAVPSAPRPDPPAAGAGAERTFGESIGLHVKFADGQPESELTMLTDLGVRWVRDSVGWRVMEPAPGKYREFPPDFERRLAFYREHDIGLVYTLAFANTTAYPPTPAEPLRPIDGEALGRYAVEAARQLKANGVRFVLEVWNEPHGFTVRDLAGGAFNGAPPSPWVKQYVHMVEEVTRQVKAAEPTIPVLDDDDMWVLHYRFMEAGLPRELSGFAFHPYTRHGPDGRSSWFPPEHAAVAADTPWTRPFVVVDADASFESAVRRLRDAGTEALGAPPELWITEWGFKLGEAGPHGPITEETVAAYLPRAYVLAANAGVRALCWFSSQDRNDGPWGLVADDGRERKAYLALRTMSRLLGELSFVRRLAGEAHRTSGGQAFLFCRGHVTCTVVAWDADDRARRLHLSGALSASAAVDAVGAPLPENADSVSVGAAPVYLTGVPFEAASSSGFPAAVEAAFD